MPVKLTTEEKIEIVLIVGDNYKTFREAANIFNERHPNKMIHFTTVGNVVTKFKGSGSVLNNFKKKHQKWINTEENQMQVMQSVIENPKTSLRKLSASLPTPLSKTTIGRVLKENKFHPYKPKFTHTLKPGDLDRRLEFCSWFQGELEDAPFMSRNILFTDESVFTSNGTVSSQNCRWWSDINPNFSIQTRDQYQFKTNVWCGMYKDRIIGPHFFRVTMNAERYLQFLTETLPDFLDALPLRERLTIWFQHDGAPCHSTRQVLEYLQDTFNGKIIGRYADVPWPPRSPDITPLDYFLWGYLKEKVYSHRPFNNIDHLERLIQEAAETILANVIRNVLDAFSKKTATCMERQGSYVEAIV